MFTAVSDFINGGWLRETLSRFLTKWNRSFKFHCDCDIQSNAKDQVKFFTLAIEYRWYSEHSCTARCTVHSLNSRGPQDPAVHAQVEILQ